MSKNNTKEFIDSLEEIECSNCKNIFYILPKASLKYQLYNSVKNEHVSVYCPYCGKFDMLEDFDEDEQELTPTQEKIKVDIFSV